MNFDWNRARAFLVTAEEGSLSAAARALGLAQPTLGRQVDGLEEELGVVLFERVGRGLRLTPAGHELVEQVRDMGAAAARLSLAAAGQSEAMEGEVSITASDAYAGLLLPPILARLREAEPRIAVRVIATNDPSDLLRREADIAIRNFRPTEPDLVAMKLGDAQGRLYGRPDYVRSLGLERPADLARARFVAISDMAPFIGMFGRLGVTLDESNFPLRCESFLVMWALIKQGLGLGLIDARIGDGDPEVTRALPGFTAIEFPVWLVAHREIHRSRRLRFVFDFLAEALR